VSYQEIVKDCDEETKIGRSNEEQNKEVVCYCVYFSTCVNKKVDKTANYLLQFFNSLLLDFYATLGAFAARHHVGKVLYVPFHHLDHMVHDIVQFKVVAMLSL
jgi:hypothetical protein